VYVDDIIITGDNVQEIVDLKCYLQKHFQTKNLGSLQNMLDIEVVRSKMRITFSEKVCT